MSTSLKQAIDAAKARVSAAFDAVEVKGGTKPSVANLAALPSAIESIPSGGSYDDDGITLKDGVTPTLFGIWYGNNVKKYDDTGYARFANGRYPCPSYVNVEELILPYLSTGITQNNGGNAFSYSPNLKKLYAPNITGFGSSNNLIRTGLEEIIMPKVASTANYVFCGYNDNLVRAEFESVRTGDVLMFAYCPKLERIKLGTLTSLSTNQFVRDCPRLIDIEIGQGTNINLSFNSWIPNASVLSDAEKVSQLNANIREHIAEKVIGTHTISFRAAIYNVLEQATHDAFATKGWTISNLG